jgi:hypothetical protein
MNLWNQIDYMKRILKDDLFSGLTVPDPLNRDTLIGAITVRCGLLTPLYSEPTTMQMAIDQWSKQMQWTFKHLIAIIEAEYSPIENTDKYSEHTTENTGGVTRTHSGTDTRTETNSGTDTVREGGTTRDQETGTTSTAHTGDDVTTTKISAYNSSAFQNDNEETTAFGGTETTTHGKGNTVTHGKTESTEHGHIVTEQEQHGLTIRDENDGSEKYTEHTHGNIGVTTNQQMIEQELELLRKFDIYGWIAQKFESDLCLMIY